MEAAKGRSIADILADITPSRKAAQVRMIWPVIVEMSEALLTHGEMTAILKREYGVQISPKHLGSVIRRISKNPPAIVVSPCLLPGARGNHGKGPLEDARQKHEEKNRPIFKGRNQDKWEQ